MKKYTLYCGLNDKDSKIQEISTIEAFKICTKIICNLAGGGTIFEADGVYTHENGEIVIEKALRIELVEISDETCNRIVAALKTAFNQESILKQVQEITTVFC